jgi:5-methylcytosine-specific restriction endonuclease McrA
VGEEIYGEELLNVSGIQEWARRVRELRVENGYDIQVVGPSTYVMLTPEPDEDRARRWQLAHRIRSRKGAAKDRIGHFLTECVGEVINRDQIDYVGKIKEGSRRVRELRDEEGWPIETHVDDPTLRPSEYRLISIDPKDRRDSSQRLYDDALRQQIFERDDYTCQRCRRNKESAEAAGDRRFYLELHHKVAIADELSELSSEERNEPGNLVTLCHSDHLRETERMQKAKRTRRTGSR